MASEKILVCDDEDDLRITISEYLEKRGYQVLLAANGRQLDAMMEKEQIGVIILDVNMPGEDGLSILRRIRSHHRVGVIMLTAMGDEIDRIVGLEMGADDYLAKPVSFRELEARLRAVLRRINEAAPLQALATNASADTPPIGFSGFVLDRNTARLIDPNGQEVSLSPLEYNLLRYFVENPGRVLSRDQILDMSHGRDWDPFDRSIDIRISRLRHKIEKNPRKPVFIRTIRSMGYIFHPEGAEG